MFYLLCITACEPAKEKNTTQTFLEDFRFTSKPSELTAITSTIFIAAGVYTSRWVYFHGSFLYTSYLQRMTQQTSSIEIVTEHDELSM